MHELSAPERGARGVDHRYSGLLISDNTCLTIILYQAYAHTGRALMERPLAPLVASYQQLQTCRRHVYFISCPKTYSDWFEATFK